jgi:hypothetical protein
MKNLLYFFIPFIITGQISAQNFTAIELDDRGYAYGDLSGNYKRNEKV